MAQGTSCGVARVDEVCKGALLEVAQGTSREAPSEGKQGTSWAAEGVLLRPLEAPLEKVQGLDSVMELFGRRCCSSDKCRTFECHQFLQRRECQGTDGVRHGFGRGHFE